MSSDVLQWSLARPEPLRRNRSLRSSRPNHWSPFALLRRRLSHALQRPRDERESVSTVSRVYSLSAIVPPTKVPAEFAHPALQELVRIGKINGSVDSEQLRVALVEAEISPKRMKIVLRSLDHRGINVPLDAATAHRSVAAPTTRSPRTPPATKRTAADKAKTAAKPVAKTTKT